MTTKDTITYIKELAQIMDAHGLFRIKVITDKRDTEIVLEKEVVQAGANATVPLNDMPIAPLESSISINSDIQSVAKVSSPVTRLNAQDINSPMVGVFYSSSSPESPPFVQIGDTIKKGDVLCILEAMKLMNEVTAEKDGKIIDICAQDGDVVEFGQVLFKMGE